MVHRLIHTQSFGSPTTCRPRLIKHAPDQVLTKTCMKADMGALSNKTPIPALCPGGPAGVEGGRRQAPLHCLAQPDVFLLNLSAAKLPYSLSVEANTFWVSGQLVPAPNPWDPMGGTQPLADTLRTVLSVEHDTLHKYGDSLLDVESHKNGVSPAQKYSRTVYGVNIYSASPRVHKG